MTNWPEIARCMAVLRPVEWLDPEALAFLRQLDGGQRVIVACSGGADSVFLTLALLNVVSRERLVVGHFHHGLRGKAADEDAAFVQSMAEALGLACEIGHPANPLEPEESALRKARYAWLVQLVRAHGAAAIATGHHADDLVETQVLALLAASGPSGMASPMPVRKFPDGHVRLRPLLTMKSATIRRTLETMGAPWREDATNRDLEYTRNRVRHEVIPALLQAAPQDLYSAASRTRRLMQEAVGAIDHVLKGLGLDASDGLSLDVGGLVGKPPGLIRRALMGWWIRHYAGHPLPAGAADRVVDCVHQGLCNEPVSVGRVASESETQPCTAVTLVLDETGCLRVGRESALAGDAWMAGASWCWAAGPLFLPDRAHLSARRVDWPEGELPFTQANPMRETWLTIEDPVLRVRGWQAGDRYQPLGSPGRRKLQDLFTDAKLNSEQKRRLPVILTKDDRILWVPGFPPADWAKVCPGSNSALKLTYDPQ